MGIGSHRMFWKAQYWVTDENFQRRSAIGKQNWVADAETPLYMGEFVSIPVHHERLMKEKQRLPTTFEVVEVTKKTDWEQVGNAGEIVHHEAISQGQEPFTASGDAIFLEVVGASNKKGHVYSHTREGEGEAIPAPVIQT